ncbi:hypothetical protein GN244_ATG02866 [Phytophthora infestans]|uniref:Uncharacterized protein n=1 Tax=Phytophthora infestans TaxID=4787 RepID=A0A833TJK8_PHYIN|nr:hypothetical protein GN244_ATG02866 [Phytophthora infestans]
MFDEDQFDSLLRRSSAVAAVDTTSTPSKKMRNEIVESMKAMTEKLCGKETSVEDKIMKMHQLIQHVETHRRAERCRKADGAPRGQSAVLPREAE